jgi:hypothetical protein
MTLNLNAQPGDESRRNGDYIGLDHPNTEERPSGGPTPSVGKPVVLGTNGEVTAAPADGTGDIVGVLYAYQRFGETVEELPDKIRPERDATVKTHGAVIADLSDQAGGGGTVEIGGTLGANGELVVLNELDAGGDLYEVLVR